MASWLGRFTPRKPKAITGNEAPTPRAITDGSGSSAAAYDPARTPLVALKGTYVHLPAWRGVGRRWDEDEGGMEDEQEQEQEGELASSVYIHPGTGVLLRLLDNGRTVEVQHTRRPTSSSGLQVTFPDQLIDLHGAPVYIDAQGRIVLVLLSQGHIYRLELDADLAGGQMQRDVSPLPDTVRHLDGARACEVLNERDVVIRCGHGMIRAAFDIDSSSWSFHKLDSPSWRLTPLLASATHLTPLTALAYGLAPGSLRVWNILTGAHVRSVDIPGAGSEAETGEVVVLPDQRGEGHRVVVHLPGSGAGGAGAFSIVRVSMDGGVLLDMRVETTIPDGARGVLRGMSVRPVYAPALGQANGEASADVSMEQEQEQDDERRTVLGHRLFALFIADGGHAVLQWTDLSAHLAATATAGQQMVRLGGPSSSTDDAPGSLALRWRTVSPAGDDPAILDTTYFDGLFPHDCTAEDVGSTFLAHVFHPGRFSEQAIEACLDNYAEALLDELEGDEEGGEGAIPHALEPSAAFPTLRARVEATIGCALETPSDPRTGAVAIDALRGLVRDEWMGFWVRLLASDRQARNALALGDVDAGGQAGEGVLVLSREGVTAVRTMDASELLLDATASVEQEEQALVEDWMDVKVPISAQYDELVAARPGSLASCYPGLVGQPSVAALLTTVRIARELSTRMADDMETLEQVLIDTLRRPAEQAPEEFGADVYARFLQPVFQDATFRTALEEQIRQVGNPERALNKLLDLVNDASAADGSAGTTASHASTALVIAAFTQTAQARHALALSLLLLVLHVSSEHPDEEDDAPVANPIVDLVCRALGTFHKYATLHWLCEQDGREAQVMGGALANANDDLPFDFQRLRMNGDQQEASSSVDVSTVYSAVHSALGRNGSICAADSRRVHGLTRAASYLDRKISTISDATDVSAGMAEVLLVRDLIQSGQPTNALAFCDRFPPQAGLAYIAALGHLALGNIDDALSCFEQVGGALNIPDWKEDSQTALGSVLPPAVLTGSSTYNRYVMGLYEAAGAIDAMIIFAERAIEEAQPDDPSVEDLWRRIFKGRLDAEDYEAAYHSMISNPFADLTSDVPGKDRPLGNLINAMCQANEVQRLFGFSFIGYEDVLESELVFKARNSDPLAFPNYHQVLYAYYMQRKKYRDAGRAMYQQGQRLHEHADIHSENFFEVAAFQAQCYLAAISAFAQVKPQNAWATVPGASMDSLGLHDRKRRRIRSNIPSDQFSQYSKDVEIVTLQDIRREYALILSTLKTISRLDTRGIPDATPTAADIVSLQCEASLYDDAFATARDLQEDMTPVFLHLTEACLSTHEVDEDSESYGESWLDTSATTCAWRGSAKDKAWRYLQLQLERHDPTARYSEIVTSAILAKGVALPVWLVDQQLKRDPENLIRQALKHGQVEQAARWGQQVLSQTATQPTKVAEGGVQPVFTPVTVLEQVIRAGSEQVYGPAAQGAAKRLRDDLEKRIETIRAVKV